MSLVSYFFSCNLLYKLCIINLIDIIYYFSSHISCQLLCVSFPSLFALASSNEAWVANMWNQSNVNSCQTPNFSRHLNDSKIEIMERFSLRFQDKAVNREGENKVIWLETMSRSFSMKSLYTCLEPGSLAPFPEVVVWNSWILPKVRFSYGRRPGVKLYFRSTSEEKVVPSKQILPLSYPGEVN